VPCVHCNMQILWVHPHLSTHTLFSTFSYSLSTYARCARVKMFHVKHFTQYFLILSSVLSHTLLVLTLAGARSNTFHLVLSHTLFSTFSYSLSTYARCARVKMFHVKHFTQYFLILSSVLSHTLLVLTLAGARSNTFHLVLSHTLFSTFSYYSHSYIALIWCGCYTFRF
jgi:hypothetical protein